MASKLHMCIMQGLKKAKDGGFAGTRIRVNEYSMEAINEEMSFLRKKDYSVAYDSDEKVIYVDAKYKNCKNK